VSQLDLFASIQEEIVTQNSKVLATPEHSEKLYHSITEVAAMFDVNASLLRFWEKEFPQMKLRKNGKGDRLFTKSDIELVGTIHYLSKVRKFTLEGTREYLTAQKKTSAKSEKNLVEQLTELRSFLQDLRNKI
jgi:DNA-binding transcriptional MerR regulator